MYRLMQPSDWAEVLALWQAQRGDTEEFVRGAVERFAGVQNVYVAEENDHIEAVALAVPVTLQGRPGSYLFGLCGQGSLLLAGLVDTLCAQQKLRGAGFVVAVPASPEQSTLLQDKGFQKAFAPGGGAQPVEPGGIRFRDGKKTLRAAGKILARHRSAAAGADGGSSAGPVFPWCDHRIQ